MWSRNERKVNGKPNTFVVVAIRLVVFFVGHAGLLCPAVASGAVWVRRDRRKCSLSSAVARELVALRTR
jgi:hypothetical protein